MKPLEQTGLKNTLNSLSCLLYLIYFYVYFGRTPYQIPSQGCQMQTDKFCQFKHRHSLFDCPSISKVKQMKRWSWQHLSQTSTVLMKIWLLSFLSGHTHAIVFRLPRVDAGHQLCDCVRGAQPRICLTNICSFMVILSRLCKHVSLWQMVLPVLVLLITLWRFANFQTLFCLPVLNKKKK